MYVICIRMSSFITQVCDEIFFFKIRVVSYVLRCADFGKILKKFWHVQFLDISRISVWNGLSLVVLLKSKTGR